jgi:hypothetical protein
MVSLPNITNDSSVVSLNYELEQADSECVAWLKIVVLVIEEHLVKTTGFLWNHIKILQHYSALDLIIIDFKVQVAHFVTLQFDKILFLSGFLVLNSFAKDDWHFLGVQLYLLVFARALDKSHDKHFFGAVVLLQRYLGVPPHQINKIHEPVDLLAFHPHLF